MSAISKKDTHCFCCGADNERGLHLSISYPDPTTAEASIEVPAWFSGWDDLAHGGLLSTLLDEIMAHACAQRFPEGGVTGDMTVRFRKPVHVGTRLRIVGKLEEARGRLARTRGWLYDPQGEVAAEASARFIVGTLPKG